MGFSGISVSVRVAVDAAVQLDVSPEALLIPAHAWTPHFSVLGAASGFDSLEECYEELTPHIHAIETGLSSDPPMNWRLSALDRITLVSNSDAHSTAKLGREANIFNTDLSYTSMMNPLLIPSPCTSTRVEPQLPTDNRSALKQKHLPLLT